MGHPRGRHGKRLVRATDLDHIEAVDGQSDPKFWDTTNHQGLCKECHGMKTAAENGAFGRAAAVRQSAA